MLLLEPVLLARTAGSRFHIDRVAAAEIELEVRDRLLPFTRRHMRVALQHTQAGMPKLIHAQPIRDTFLPHERGARVAKEVRRDANAGDEPAKRSATSLPATRRM